MIEVRSSSLKVVGRPRLAPTRLDFLQVVRGMEVGLHAIGSVTFSGSPTDQSGDWSVGFLQALQVEADWCVYRGDRPEDGSVLIDFGRPPALPQQICQDHISIGSPYYKKLNELWPDQNSGPQVMDGIGAKTLPAYHAFPLTQTVAHGDAPNSKVRIFAENRATSKNNYLYRSLKIFNFVTILAARGPDDRLVMLRGFYWTCSWSDRYSIGGERAFSDNKVITTLSPIPVLRKSFTGVPDDKRFLDALTRPQPVTCTLLQEAAIRDAAREERTDWTPFDVEKS